MLIILAIGAAFAQEEKQEFPFSGQIKKDNVNIRSGPGQNFEILSKLNSDDLVSAIGESYGWYKIALPKGVFCYVSKDYIDTNGGAEGVSNAARLNVRARPNKESIVLSQIAKGGTVQIVGEDEDGWYKINPPSDCYGWVRRDMVGLYVQEQANLQAPVKIDPAIKKAAVPADSNLIKIKGRVEKIGFTIRKRPGTHKLFQDKEFVYYLKTDKYNLKDFQGKEAAITGKIIEGDFDRPLIIVENIEAASFNNSLNYKLQ